jgi:hypothetical protein
MRLPTPPLTLRSLLPMPRARLPKRRAMPLPLLALLRPTPPLMRALLLPMRALLLPTLLRTLRKPLPMLPRKPLRRRSKRLL